MNKAALIRRVESSKAKIAAERDKLRELIDEAVAIVESSDEAVDDLQRAIDALSQYL